MDSAILESVKVVTSRAKAIAKLALHGAGEYQSTAVAFVVFAAATIGQIGGHGEFSSLPIGNTCAHTQRLPINLKTARCSTGVRSCSTEVLLILVVVAGLFRM
jgi:hypothetical protein